jgi:rRNA biogenesis protein RRP5
VSPCADIKTITKFAQLEYRHGEAERGRTLFEGIVGHYARRADLWGIYIAMEEGVGDPAAVRYVTLAPTDTEAVPM